MNALKLDLFKEISEKSFLDKNAIVSKYTELDTGIEKLRVKHKALEQAWSRIDFPLTRSLAGLNILIQFFVREMKPSVSFLRIADVSFIFKGSRHFICE